MNKLTITLKQHTPLLHFQPMQEGATLRASEVKPKLDKFLIDKLGGIKSVPKDWRLPNPDPNVCALNYKMRISAKTNDKDILLEWYTNKQGKWATEVFPHILSNMGGKDSEEELANLVKYNEVIVTIVVMQKKGEVSLYEYIKDEEKELLPAFFAIHNFGQRGTKGFGSFTVARIESEDGFLKDYNAIYYHFPVGTPWLKIPKGKGTEKDIQTRLFTSLDYYWKCLKSGVNYTKRMISDDHEVSVKFPDRYVKAFLYKYLNSKNLTWEKQRIKETFDLGTKYPEREYERNNNTAIYGRALLGLQEHFEYRVPQGAISKDRSGKAITDKKGNFKEVIKTTTVKIVTPTVHREGANGRVEDYKPIDRIPSPIMLKPFVDGDYIKVYVLVDGEVVNKIREEQQRYTLDFTFNVGERNLCLPLNVDSIDFNELIKEYHRFLNFEMIPRDFRWENVLDEDKDKRWNKSNGKNVNKIEMKVTPPKQ